MFAGTHTAIVTPFKNGQVDEAALKRLVDFQFDNGVTGIVPCGIREHGVTSLVDLGLPVTMDDLDSALRTTFDRTMSGTCAIA